MNNEDLKTFDPEIYNAIKEEIKREQDKIVLIASENYASKAVLQAQGSVFTNKYAEGYPGRRYYGGCEFADQVELLAIERAKELFGAEHVNVQLHSGSQANMAGILPYLNPEIKSWVWTLIMGAISHMGLNSIFRASITKSILMAWIN